MSNNMMITASTVSSTNSPNIVNVGTFSGTTRSATSLASPDETVFGTSQDDIWLLESSRRSLSPHNIEPSATLDPANLGNVGKARQAQEVVTELRTWEGTVTRIDEDIYVATLQPEDGTPRLTVELSVSDLSADDRKLLAPGAYFYVATKRTRTRDGRILTTSSIHFRRLAPWTKSKINKIMDEAAAYREELGFAD
jgi:hypothetical protein